MCPLALPFWSVTGGRGCLPPEDSSAAANDGRASIIRMMKIDFSCLILFKNFDGAKLVVFWIGNKLKGGIFF